MVFRSSSKDLVMSSCSPYDLFVCTVAAVGDFLGSTLLDNASAFPLSVLFGT